MHSGMHFRNLIGCIVNDQSRVSARFAVLRRHPSFRNKYCNRKMCFNCKIMSHHKGFSCESRLLSEASIGVSAKVFFHPNLT